MAFRDELNKAIHPVVLQQPIAIRAATEGTQPLDSQQMQAWKVFLQTLDLLYQAADELERLHTEE